MIKKFIKHFLFPDKTPVIRSGIAAGKRTLYSPDDRSQHLLGIYEWEIHSAMDKACRRADVLVDIGANDGYYGLAFSRYKGTHRVLCEPGEERFDLIRNMELNGLQRGVDYELIEKRITDNDASDEMSINTLLEEKENVFVLIDVDGGEGVIMQAYDFLHPRNIDWLIETHTLELETSIVDRLRREGYRVTIMDKAWWRVIVPEHRPLAHNRWLFATRRPW